MEVKTMIEIVFHLNKQAKFVEISSSTYERLWLYREKNKVSVQQVADAVFDKFGSVSESLIIQYLDLMATPPTMRSAH